MLSAIRHAFANLAHFEGRDCRRQFWMFALFVLVVVQAGMMAVIVPLMDDPIGGPEPAFGQVIRGVAIVSAVAVLLLAAAVARRLHDTGRSGAWGLLPLPCLFFGLYKMSQFFAGLARRDPEPGSFTLIFVNNLVYLACLGLLVFLLARPGVPGDNRYGPPPPAEA
jgi:uncharacterized membrane protein YhaH (DUF805 family)